MNYNEIKRYLEGKTSDDESIQIKSWIIDPENDFELRRILGEIWTNSEISLNGKSPDFNRILNQVHHQINSDKSLSLHTEKRSTNLYQLFSRVAAILVIPLIIMSVYFYFNPKNRDDLAAISMHEIYTKPGTRTKIELSDGTNVWLNDGTTFRYPERFIGQKREVFVDGEAYFEVKSNPKNPFLVKNPLMNTLVTGTHFNLNAYSIDKYFEATLIEGKINLETKGSHYLMNPCEQVQYDSQLGIITKHKVDPHNAAAWVSGKLIFKDEKLAVAIKKLSRWYNVEIILEDEQLKNYLFTATLQDEKLDQTLELISLVLPINYKFKKANSKTEIQRTIYMTRK